MDHKISAWGFAALLALSRIFTEATFMPGESIRYGMQRFTVIIASFLLTGIMYIPLFFAARRSGENFIMPIARRSRTLAVLIGLPYAVYLLFTSAETGLRSHYYTSSTVFDSAPSFYFYLFMGAALVFAVFKGVEAVTRTGVIIFAGLGFLLLLMILALIPEIKLDRLYPALFDDRDGFMPEVMAEFSINNEALIFALLCGNVREKAHRCIPVYLGISCVVILFMTFMYNTVFGRLTTLLDFPFYTLSSVSDISILNRINGIDVMVWMMSGALKLAMFAFAFRSMVHVIFGGERASNIAAAVFALLTLGLAWLFTAYPDLFDPLVKFRSTGTPLVLAAVIAPAISLTMRARGERDACA